MSAPTAPAASRAVGVHGFAGRAVALLRAVNALAAIVSGIAVGAAGCVLTWEATARYLFKIPSDWQDEMSIFLLVGATFLSAGWVQERRGHIGIQALGAVLSDSADRRRRYVSDVVTLVFCTFFCWKCWSLLAEAVKDGQISGSAWGAPLWVPYGCMAVGMTLLVLEVAVQVLTRQALREASPQ